MNLAQLPGAPFDFVLDVGGNVGDFADAAAQEWPQAKVISFEPIPGLVSAQRGRAHFRIENGGNDWVVYQVAISEHHDNLTLHFNRTQHSASTMQAPGTGRREFFGLEDSFETVQVETRPLDFYLPSIMEGDKAPRVLVKVDVEGHELHVLRGARRTLVAATTVICEVNQSGSLFLGSPAPWMVDGELRRHGLHLWGVIDALKAPPPSDELLQFDGVWTRAFEPWRKQP